MDVEDAYAAWRLDNPKVSGWPLEAFKAGWRARSLEVLVETLPKHMRVGPVVYGFDLCSDGMTVVASLRRPDGTLEIIDEAHIPPDVVLRAFP